MHSSPVCASTGSMKLHQPLKTAVRELAAFSATCVVQKRSEREGR